MREAIKDAHNRVVAYYHHESNGSIRVTNAHGQLLGYVCHNGTFDAHNRFVSRQQEPGLLLH